MLSLVLLFSVIVGLGVKLLSAWWKSFGSGKCFLLKESFVTIDCSTPSCFAGRSSMCSWRCLSAPIQAGSISLPCQSILLLSTSGSSRQEYASARTSDRRHAIGRYSQTTAWQRCIPSPEIAFQWSCMQNYLPRTKIFQSHCLDSKVDYVCNFWRSIFGIYCKIKQ